MTKEEIFEKLNDNFMAYNEHKNIIQCFKAQQKAGEQLEISNFIFEHATLMQAYKDKIMSMLDKLMPQQDVKTTEI